MRLIVLFAAFAVTLAMASTAAAYDLKRASGEAGLHFQQRRLHHADTAMVWLKHHRRWLAIHAPSSFRYSRAVRDMLWLRKAAAAHIAALTRPAAPAHLAGWRCITNGAYPGAPHEGNGYNGPYTGPLGMTTPWAGHDPPGADWVHADPLAVYSIAEQEYARNGHSKVWLTGQWPRTYPPCARLFD